MSFDPVVYASDAGSVPKGNFSWVTSYDLEKASDDIEALAQGIVADLQAGRPVALGLECVLFIPCPEAAMELGKARSGECTPETGNKPFAASAGACATMTGLPALAWLLRAIHRKCPEVTGTTRWKDFAAGEAQLFVWEAFVSGQEKGDSDHDDARLAIESFQANLDQMEQATRVTAEGPVSFAGGLLLWAGLSHDTTLLQEPAVVLRPLATQHETVRRSNLEGPGYD